MGNEVSLGQLWYAGNALNLQDSTHSQAIVVEDSRHQRVARKSLRAARPAYALLTSSCVLLNMKDTVIGQRDPTYCKCREHFNVTEHAPTVCTPPLAAGVVSGRNVDSVRIQAVCRVAHLFAERYAGGNQEQAGG